MSHGQDEICYAEVVDYSNLWGSYFSPLNKPVPQLVLQMALAITVNHGLFLILQRYGQPQYMSNILTALVLSPSTLSRIHHNLGQALFPTKSFTILKSVANLGLLYAMFIRALQAEPTPISRHRTRILCFSFFIFVFPFTIGYALYFSFQKFIKGEQIYNIVEIVSIYWGTTITATCFATLAPVLAKLKLLCTRIGQEVLFVGLLNNIFTWGLISIVLAISTSSSNHNNIQYAATCYVLLSMVLYMIICCTMVKLAISKLSSNAYEGENNNNFLVNMVLILVLASGLITDYLGSHFIFGSYLLGRSIPPGFLAKTVIEKMEDCVNGVLMPLYFVMIGIKIDISELILNFKYTWIIVLAVSTKLFCTILIGKFCRVSLRDGLPLGILLSAKGLLPLVLINIGHERGHLTGDSFSVPFLIIVLSTILVGPIINICYKQARMSTQSYDVRCIEGATTSEEIRLITCVHTSRNIPSIINLLEASNITTEYPALVNVTHLIELLGHASATLIEHELEDSFLWKLSSKFFVDRARAQSDEVINAFNEYAEQHNAIDSFRVLTIVSPIDTMHHDIHSLAEDKQANLIVLPFHKQQGIDGQMEVTNIEFGTVNQNVLDNAPCSIALLVDRGLRIYSLGSSDESESSNKRGCEEVQVAMLFIGGPDDREALTYAWRMAAHPFVYLTVIRFVEGDHDVMEIDQNTKYLKHYDGNNEADILIINAQNQKEKQLDNVFLKDLQEKTASDESIYFREEVVNSGEELLSSLKDIHIHDKYNLYIVGRGKHRFSLLTIGLVEWNECNELGTIGNILVTSDFTSDASVLVLQQYASGVNNKKLDEKSSNEEDTILINSHEQP